MERDLRTLRRSKLMNYSEFRVMTTALERYYKDVKIAILTGKREAKDLDLRPYLYDEGDPYDKPFYGTLLKMLSEVATTKYFDKQHEDLMKIYKWYKANKKLISSPPKIQIPNPEKNEKSSDGYDSFDEDEEEEELEELTKVPKLHLRPKTAPSVEGHRGVRYVTWNEAQQQNESKRPLSASKAFKQQRDLWNRDSLTRSLHISAYGPQPSGGSFIDQDVGSDRYILRPGTAPAVFRSSKGKVNQQQLKSFILRPANSRSAPFSSPIVSPPSSPRDPPVPTSRTRSPLSAHFSPGIVKETSVKLSSGIAKDKIISHETAEEVEMRNGNVEKKDCKMNSTAVNETNSAEKLAQRVIPKDATSSDVERILKNQKEEEALLEEQHELLQKKLHDHNNYTHDLGLSPQKKVDLEIVNGNVTLKKVLQDGRNTIQAAHVATYDLSAPEIIPSYSIMYSGTGSANGHSRSLSDNSLKKSSITPARHVRHATVPYNNPQEVIKVDAVLGLVTPIAAQMEHDRDRMIKQEMLLSGHTPTMRVPIVAPSKPPLQGLTIPVSEETTSTTDASSSEKHQLTPSEQGIPSDNNSSLRPASVTFDSNSVELKYKEPELIPERNPRDYTVHFPQEKTQERTSAKSYKTSGPVIPDTIRYQWTDDGFGHRTYLKKLQKQSPTSPRGTGKKVQIQPTFQVTMPTGTRSLDKRTLASLVLVKHLGDADRRSIDRLSLPQNGRLIYGPTHDHSVSDYSYNLEYMPICQPVGPRLGECENSSTVNWYLQGEHGLYREPFKGQTGNSDDSKTRLSDVRIPKDKTLIVEGHHLGPDDNKQEQRLPWEQKDVSAQSAVSVHSGHGSVFKTKDTVRLSSSARPSSPRPSSEARPSSPASPRKMIPIPTASRSSRPSSARSVCSSHHAVHSPNFTVRSFNHFCWDEEYLLTEDYMRQREVWAAVNIQRIFRGYMARQYLKQLRVANVERQRKAAITLQSNFRGFLTRKKQMEQNVQAYTPSSRDLEWARKYKQDLKKRADARKQKNQYSLYIQNREAEKQEQQMRQVQAHQHIFEVFHPTPEGPTKAEKKAAAITIQRYFRGWFVRRMLAKSKEKALKRTLSYNKFIKGYQALLYRIQERYGIKEPRTALQFNELMEYVDRLNKYEVAFDKFATKGVLEYRDIKKFFESVGHVPSQKEIDEAIEIVTKMSAKDRSLTKAEAVEVLFQIYVPKGTKLNLADVRKSTWLNPLDDGRDIMQLLSKKDLEQTNLLKCFEVVAGAGKENDDIKSLLQPESAKPTEKKQDGKKRSSPKPPHKTVLAQYPMRPSTPNSKFPRSPSAKKPSKR